MYVGERILKYWSKFDTVTIKMVAYFFDLKILVKI